MTAAAAQIARAYRGRRALVTGHTGFKGGWLSLWLHDLGAEVSGYALAPDAGPTLYGAARIDELVRSVEADVRDRERFAAEVAKAQPDVIFHLAAQPLVRKSYREPVETFAVNVLGTAHLLEAVRGLKRPCAVVIASSDKCYENDGARRARRESDALGGHDPYSASKAGCELVVSSYRASFFPPERLGEHGVALGSVRAGNVIGGGDFAEDRIVPDAIRAFAAQRPLEVRSPEATRPFQHVVEPLAGYLILGARLLGEGGSRAEVCRPFNLGPAGSSTVRALVDGLGAAWGAGARWEHRVPAAAAHEAQTLILDSSDARDRLGWTPHFGLADAAVRTANWYRAWHGGAAPGQLRDLFRRDAADWLSR